MRKQKTEGVKMNCPRVRGQCRGVAVTKGERL